MPEPDVTFTQEELKQIAYLLLGASVADLEYHEKEIDTIMTLLTEQAGEEAIAETFVEHMKSFDPHGFDPVKACAAVDFTAAPRRKALLGMVVKVIDADEIRDLDEDSYLVKVAKAIGAGKEEYEDLILDVIEGEDESKPPPIPR